jgi:hypothetical protein
MPSQPIEEADAMRLILISMVALAMLAASNVPGFACPKGYAPCGTRYCCPAPK